MKLYQNFYEEKMKVKEKIGSKVHFIFKEKRYNWKRFSQNLLKESHFALNFSRIFFFFFA